MRHFTKSLLQLYFLSLALLVLVACAGLGTESPDTFNQKLAVGYGTVTQIRSTATTLLQAKKIGADDAQNVNNQADNARAGLDIARTVSQTDMTAANAKLTAVSTALQALQTYLSARK